MPGLTHKQSLFVDAYIGPAQGNATEAARLAGYSPKTAHAIGQENLTKPAIVQAISTATEHIRAKRGMLNPQERMAWLARVVNGEELDTYTSSEHGWLDGPPQLKDRLKALDLLNKMQGIYLQQVEHTHRMVPMVNPDTPTPMIEARVIELRGNEDA